LPHNRRDLVSDPLRSESIPASHHDDPDRDAKIENLLLAGLDHYFCSDYAQAIDVWTRALFLDRNHARARAYIERARTALAERQRESEELLHTGIAAFERGELDAARELLNAAVQRGGAHEVALAFLTRIDRISAAAPGPVPGPSLPARSAGTVPAPVSRRSRKRIVLTLAALIAVVAAIYGLATWDEVLGAIPGLSSAGETSTRPSTPVLREQLPVPRASDTAIERAEMLFASGHLYDALRLLDTVRPTDPSRASADRLKASIQRELLSQQPPPAAVNGQ
jgi:tetratricopeptide (TPR) repeat protein